MSYILKLRLKEKKGKTTNNDNNKLGIYITLIATITSETILLTVFFFFFNTFNVNKTVAVCDFFSWLYKRKKFWWQIRIANTHTP